MIADILVSIGTGFFIIAELRQIRRMHRTKATMGVSLTHYHMKLAALGCMILAWILLNLHLSLFVSITELILQIIAIYLICKYRQISILSL
jgi:hypothetical protein